MSISQNYVNKQTKAKKFLQQDCVEENSSMIRKFFNLSRFDYRDQSTKVYLRENFASNNAKMEPLLCQRFSLVPMMNHPM